MREKALTLTLRGRPAAIDQAAADLRDIAKNAGLEFTLNVVVLDEPNPPTQGPCPHARPDWRMCPHCNNQWRT